MLYLVKVSVQKLKTVWSQLMKTGKKKDAKIHTKDKLQLYWQYDDGCYQKI